MFWDFIGHGGAKRQVRRLGGGGGGGGGGNWKCLQLYCYWQQDAQQESKDVVITGVVILASTTCSMFCKLVTLVILLRMCATDAAFYSSKTSAPQHDTVQIPN